MVIAVVDGSFTVKQLCRLQEGVLLRSGAKGHGDILVTGDQQLVVWGAPSWPDTGMPLRLLDDRFAFGEAR